MQNLIGKSLVIALILLSACFSSSVLSGSPMVPDSLSDATEREVVAASLLSAKGDYRGAVDRYQKLLSAHPTQAAFHYALSKAYLSLGVLDSARLYSEKSVALQPGNKYYLRLLAGISHQTRDYPRAIELYQQLVALEPGNTEPLSSLALEYLVADQQEKALAVFQDLSKLDPKNETILNQVLFMELKLARYQDAIGTLTELIKRSDGKEKLTLSLGELYLQTGQYDPAVKTFKELVQNNQSLLPAWLGLFDATVKSGNRNAFRDDLNLFYNTSQISLDQKIGLAQFFAARSARDSFSAEPAFAMIDEMKRRYSSVSGVTFKLQVVEGELLFHTGKVKEALQLLEKILPSKKGDKKSGLDLHARSILALCYDTLGYTRKSISLYEAILRLEPGNLLMVNNLAYVLAGQGKELQRARTLAMKAVAAEPANAGYLDTLGWIFFKMGEYEKAAELLEKAVVLDSQEPEISDHLSQAYEKLGNRQKAMEMKEMTKKLKAKQSAVSIGQ